MRWQGREGSKNVDDRRRNKRRVQTGAGIGLGTLLLLALALFMGEDPTQVLNQVQQPAPTQTQSNYVPNEEEEALAQFVSVVLKETEDVWHKLFREKLGRRYVEPTLVLFSSEDQSACGFASAATGPFYCPADQSVYIDLDFYRQLKERFEAPGDFAMAYVVAHEVAHHVQHLLGITTDVASQQRRAPKKLANELSVRLELQADFLAGVWAHHGQRMKQFLEEGDLEEALNAAKAIGDDHIQMKSRGYVVPESFTHGTSEQRMRWFARGVQTGDLSQGDTFNTNNL
ncbi:MAG: neutral zinc metallopeptidase [Bacteroidota bacterium]